MSTSAPLHIGLIIKHLREELALSQEALADRANLNRSYVGEVERGTATPSLNTVIKLAGALNLSTSDLLARFEAYEKNAVI